MRETDIQNKIRCDLSAYGVVARMNTGVFFSADGRPVKCGIPGMPDLLFIGPDGRIAWIEVKTLKGRPYPKSKQVARCGNAVTPPVPAALVRANLPEYCKQEASA